MLHALQSVVYRKNYLKFVGKVTSICQRRVPALVRAGKPLSPLQRALRFLRALIRQV